MFSFNQLNACHVTYVSCLFLDMSPIPLDFLPIGSLFTNLHIWEFEVPF